MIAIVIKFGVFLWSRFPILGLRREKSSCNNFQSNPTYHGTLRDRRTDRKPKPVSIKTGKWSLVIMKVSLVPSRPISA